MEKKDMDRSIRRNEGEENHPAAREYNQAQQRLVKSGQEQQARYAAQDLDHESIRRELEHAEAIGKRHIHEEDPRIRRR